MFTFRLRQKPPVKAPVKAPVKPLIKVPVKLNYRKQKVDKRDYLSLKETPSSLPLTYIPEFDSTLVLNQGNFGSCVACAMNVSIRLLNKDINPSLLHMYYHGRLTSGCSNLEDTGLEIRDACKVVQKIGYCTASTWRYNQENFYALPTNADGSLITPSRINDFKYFSVNQNINDLKKELVAGNSILCGIYVYSSFLSAANGGQVPMPRLTTTYKMVKGRKVLDKQAEQFLGGHCILIIGYNEKNFICVNSWGTKWGVQGKFYLPYAYIENPKLSIDFTYVTM